LFINILLNLVLSSFLVFLIGCYNGNKTLTPHVFNENIQVEESYSLVIEPKVDILFVIDDSASMQRAQSALATNIQLFTSSMELNKYLDYNIGVISTSYGSGYPSLSGKLQGSTRIVSKNTKDGLYILENNVLNLGLNGNGSEKVFDPIQASIDTDLNLNPGFLRSDAFLVLILITDADDQSQLISGYKLFSNLVNLKANDINRVLGYAVLSFPDFFQDECSQDERDPIYLMNFISLFSNATDSRVGIDMSSKKDLITNIPDRFFSLKNIFSLCDPNFGEKLANIGKDVRLRVSQKIPLPFRPVDGSVILKYGTKVESQVISKKWWKYDFGTNSIILDPLVDFKSTQSDAQLFVTMDKADPYTVIGNP
jgi:hypothetical protein